MNTSHSWTIADYFRALFRFKWRALAFFAFCLLLAELWITLVPRRYESESKLFVRIGRENAALDPTLTKGETMSLNVSREEEMNSIIEHLRSRCILEKALALLDPDSAQASAEDRETAFVGLKNALYVASPRSSNVVTVQGWAKSPEQAQRVVATVVDVYLEEHMRICRSAGSYEFFRKQSGRLDEQLEAAQAELCNAKNKAGMASIEGRRAALESQISTVETRIHETSAALAAAEAKARALKAAIESLPEPLLKQMVGGIPNDGLAAMCERLFQLQVREEEVRSKYTRSHPVAVAVHEQVQEVAGTLKREGPERAHLIAAISAHEIANQASLSAEKQSLQNQLVQLQKSLATLNDDEVRINKLTRKARQMETTCLAYAENMEEARMDQALRADRISNVSIIQPATFVVLPVRPQKATTLFLGMLGGLVGGILIALLSAQWYESTRARDNRRANLDRSNHLTVSRPHDNIRPSGRNGAAAPLEKGAVDA